MGDSPAALAEIEQIRLLAERLATELSQEPAATLTAAQRSAVESEAGAALADAALADGLADASSARPAPARSGFHRLVMALASLAAVALLAFFAQQTWFAKRTWFSSAENDGAAPTSQRYGDKSADRAVPAEENQSARVLASLSPEGHRGRKADGWQSSSGQMGGGGSSNLPSPSRDGFAHGLPGDSSSPAPAGEPSDAFTARTFDLPQSEERFGQKSNALRPEGPKSNALRPEGPGAGAYSGPSSNDTSRVQTRPVLTDAASTTESKPVPPPGARLPSATTAASAAPLNGPQAAPASPYGGSARRPQRPVGIRAHHPAMDLRRPRRMGLLATPTTRSPALARPTLQRRPRRRPNPKPILRKASRGPTPAALKPTTTSLKTSSSLR